ncbi:C1q-like domain-containing protein [Marinicrinis lubricantis]|uniref:ABC transporter permease n=1 Tax=Marinicrinis lubricantis TaxID=2086470 RepID=A0ABW1IP75_9BACL
MNVNVDTLGGFAITSAFRAVNTTSAIPVAANTPVKVLFPNEQFDLANEYNPANSTFTPSRRGVYSILGTIAFNPTNPNVNYRARVEIRVNGAPAVAIDNDFFGPSNFINVVTVSTILQLQAGDRVEVFAESNTAGSIAADTDTRFEAARFPSPQ